MPPDPDVVALLPALIRPGTAAPSLTDLAARSGWSAFHLHRAFTRVVGETPKQFAVRVRLERSAATLAAGTQPVHAVARQAGFSGYAVFARAFRRHFGRTPGAYRRHARAAAGRPVRARHARLVAAAAPCVRLFHAPVFTSPRSVVMPMLTAERRELAAQPFLHVHASVSRAELPAAIADGLGRTFGFATAHGLTLAGPPTVRYAAMSPGLLTVDIGVPLAAPAAGSLPEGFVMGSLAGGPALVAVHGGSYDSLGETYAAMERWAAEHGGAFGGAPWEVYLTDPAEHPDPADWRTEIRWPLRSA